MDETDEAALAPSIQRFVDADGFEDAYDIVVGNCSDVPQRRAWVRRYSVGAKRRAFGDGSAVAFAAKRIYLQAGVTHAMPPPSASYLEAEDRAVLVAWYRAATAANVDLIKVENLGCVIWFVILLHVII